MLKTLKKQGVTSLSKVSIDASRYRGHGWSLGQVWNDHGICLRCLENPSMGDPLACLTLQVACIETIGFPCELIMCAKVVSDIDNLLSIR